MPAGTSITSSVVPRIGRGLEHDQPRGTQVISHGLNGPDDERQVGTAGIG